MRKLSSQEVQKVLDILIGETEPVADSAIDERINDNLMVLIDIVNWSLDGVYDAARHRKSPYYSQQAIGQRAYSAMNDQIDRQAAIDAIERLQMPIMRSQDNVEQFKFAGMAEAREAIIRLPSAQPEITDEQAIEHLQSTGWMQSHDRILTERRTE